MSHFQRKKRKSTINSNGLRLNGSKNMPRLEDIEVVVVAVVLVMITQTLSKSEITEYRKVRRLRFIKILHQRMRNRF